MAKNKKKKSLLPRNIADIPTNQYPINLNVAECFGHTDTNQKPYVVLKYYQSQFECFSVWNDLILLKNFTKLINNISKMTWNQIYATSGKTQKSGLAFTYHKNSLQRIQKDYTVLCDILSNDILDSFFELRVNNQSRVHGFRNGAGFFLVFLDRNHKFFQ
ncbi:MAG: hypothetical protein RBU23_12055 [Candidatus Auribacterota bacterium]|jgi:hypothetical protein|nr:hypothetical protein [Candidatus Auribacterota bacterium]